MFTKIENKKLDLLAAYKRKEGPSQLEIVAKMMLIPCLIVLALIIGYASVKNGYDKLLVSVNEVNRINEALQNDINQYSEEEYNRYLQLQEEYETLLQVEERLSSHSTFSAKSYKEITKAMSAGMSLTSINYNQSASTISLNATSNDVRNIEKYIKKIKELPQVSAVEYNGYTQNTKTVKKVKQTYYSFSIRIKLGGGE